MTPYRWIALLCFYLSYLFLGATIYYYIEHNEESYRRAQALEERIEINEYLVYHLSEKDADSQEKILSKISTYCNKPVTNYTLDQHEDPYTWTFYHSFFFAFTVCSTVGYGNIAPTTTTGRMIMIAYSLFGVPMNGILFAGLGEYFGRFFTNIYRKYKDYKYLNNVTYVPRKFGLFATIIMALVPGITFFLMIPSLIFSYFENWPFSLAFYYSYVTTTTIGFGDYVPTFQKHQEREFGVLFIFYQIFVIIWFIFSLGYLLMILSFITKGLRSKKLFELEFQLKEQIKVTQHRIWHGVVKDISYLRQILNEVYINAKPIYESGVTTGMGPRSSSCPDLEMYRPPDFTCMGRKRAFSEGFDQFLNEDCLTGTPIHHTLLRPLSDTNLHRINKEKTFETINAFKETTHLLAKVVSALNNMKPPVPNDDVVSINSAMFGAYHGFSDSQILSSEWSFTQAQNPIIKKRLRANSDFHLNPKTIPTSLSNEWTWGGDNNQIQQVINDRLKSNNKDISSNCNLDKLSSTNNNHVLETVEKQESQSKKRKFSTDSFGFIKRLLPIKRKMSRFDSDRRHSVCENTDDQTKSPPTIDNHYSTIHGLQTGSVFDKMKITSVFPKYESRKSSISKQIESKNNSSYNTIIQEGQDTLGSLAHNFIERKNSIIARSDRRDSLFSRERHDSSSSKERYGSLSPADWKDNLSIKEQNDNILTRLDGRRSSGFVRGRNRNGSFLLPDRGRSSSRSYDKRPNFDKRGSVFSVPSQDDIDRDVLEQTSIADIIRALELLHTQAYMSQPIDETQNSKKKRKIGTAEPPKPALFNLFTNYNVNDLDNQSNNQNLGRRSTLFGNLLSSASTTGLDNQSNNQNLGRRSTLFGNLLSSASTTGLDNQSNDQNLARRSTLFGNLFSSASNTDSPNNFGRRSSMLGNLFSSKSTTKSDINNHLRKKSTSMSEDVPAQPLPPSNKFKRFSIRPVSDDTILTPSQTTLQRKLSLRPSIQPNVKRNAPTPLSRIAQMQSIRKNSMADLEGIKPDENK